MPHRQARAGVAAAALVAAVTGMLAAGPRTTWDGVFTGDQAQAGEAAYDEYCATCHLPSLEGGEDAPPLVGAPFSVVWEGRSLAELVGRMQARMPQDAPGSLSRNAYVDIVAFLLQKNGFPAGAAPLALQAESLADIRYFVRPRP